MTLAPSSPFLVYGPFLSPNVSVGVVITAPALTDPTDGTPTAEGAEDATVDTDVGNGALYWAVVSDGGECTDAQLKSGSGGDIEAAGAQGVSGTGTQTVAEITGLESATAYQIKFLHTSAGGSDSAQASVDLTTA